MDSERIESRRSRQILPIPRFLRRPVSLLLVAPVALIACTPPMIIKDTRSFDGCVTSEAFQKGEVMSGSRIPVATEDRHTLTLELEGLGQTIFIEIGADAKMSDETYDKGDRVRVTYSLGESYSEGDTKEKERAEARLKNRAARYYSESNQKRGQAMEGVTRKLEQVEKGGCL